MDLHILVMRNLTKSGSLPWASLGILSLTHHFVCVRELAFLMVSDAIYNNIF